jgi:uncharacterized protein YecE (DUF72 family)
LSYQRWYDQAPTDFIFRVKSGHFTMHMRRLRDVQIPLANFFVSGILCLREKLGPILSQFPPTFLWNGEIPNFFELLLRDTRASRKKDAACPRRPLLDLNVLSGKATEID